MVKKEKSSQTREYTVNIAKVISKTAHQKRAAKAVKHIKNFAGKEMNTKDVRLDVNLNKYVWSKGVANVPRRVRIRCSRRLNEDDDADEAYYTLVEHVVVTSFKGLSTKKVEE
mmetsp:Transcript_11178/g.18713  ORF Transcript_11178/g.18713 Transcript_11178/m.18713 type:complete len:113 (+) Transcript_11178:56-394(+)